MVKMMMMITMVMMNDDIIHAHLSQHHATIHCKYAKQRHTKHR